MIRKFFVSTFVLLFLSLSAFTQNANVNVAPQINKEQEIPSKSVIRGRVTYEDTGIPVRRGMIGLLDITDIQKAYESRYYGGANLSADGFVLTNDDGEFEIKNVKAGSYYPFVEVPNVLSPYSIGKFYGTYNPLSLIKLEELFQKITVDGYSQVQAFVNVKRGAAISGRIVYSDGGAAIGATVEVVRKDSEDEEEIISVKQTVTDDRGFYRFNELPPGEYFIKLTQPSDHNGNGDKIQSRNGFTNNSELTGFYPNAENIKAAKSVIANWGQEQTDFDIIIPNRQIYKISGTVVAKDTKKPLEDVKLTFRKVDEETGEAVRNYNRSQISSDEKGNWLFKDLPRGTYQIQVAAFEDNDSEKKNAPKYAEVIKEIKIEDKNLQDIVIELPFEASVSGTVTFEGKKDFFGYAYIFLSDSERKTYFSTNFSNYRDEDKSEPAKKKFNFRVGGISAGKFTVKFYNEGGEFYVKSIKIGSSELSNGAIEIKEGEEIKDVQIILTGDVGILKGKVFEAQNKPAKLKWILLIPTDAGKQQNDNLYFNAKTNLNGEFETKAAPGEYFVVFQFRSNKISEEEWLRSATKDAPKATVKANETTEISITLPEK